MARTGTRRLADMTGSRTHAFLCSGVRRRLHPWASRRCSGWWDCGSCTACFQQRGLTECSAVTASRHRQGEKATTVPNPQQESPFGHSIPTLLREPGSRCINAIGSDGVGYQQLCGRIQAGWRAFLGPTISPPKRSACTTCFCPLLSQSEIELGAAW
jgi:hypothetical protein